METPAHLPRRIVAVACPLCGGTESASVLDEPDPELEWVRCPCTLVYKRSEKTTAQHESPGDVEHYDREYFRRYERRRRRRIAKSRRQILDALEVAPRGRLLDVGCSLGYTLEAARGLGLDAHGIDLSTHAIEHCRGLGLEARPGTLASIPADDATYAVAILKHVFEHTSDPRGALTELRRVLMPGAAVLFAVPNAEYRRAVRSPQASRFFRGEAGRAHFVYYSPATLSRLLESEGFRIAGVHPRVLHHRAKPMARAAELAVLPVRLALRAATDALRLRKEFWLVAVRT